MWYLLLAEKPSVLEGPEPVIVGLQNATANPPTFNCVVGGAPAPSLIWSYIPGLDEDRSAIFLENRDEYDITTNVSAQDNGLTVVNSTVKFLKVANTDGGIVRCNARRDPVTVYEDALLTVLGMTTHPAKHKLEC